MNMILTEAIISEDLKCNIIRPIYKGSECRENYLPICIFPAIEKVIEKYESVKVKNYYYR